MHFRKFISLLAVFLVLTRPLPAEPLEVKAVGIVKEVPFSFSD